MTSAVGICNLALAHLGNEANVSSIEPPEGSAEADHCAMFYPIARDSMLEDHAWSFNTKRISLALLDITPPDTWLFAYAMPTASLKVIRVRPPNQILDGYTCWREWCWWWDCLRTKPDTQSDDFEVEVQQDGTKVLYTNVEDAIALYTVSITDTNKFSPLFVTALSRLLASYLAGPIIKGTEGMRVGQAQREFYEKVDLPKATMSDSNARQNNSYDKFTPSGVSARD